LSFPRGRKAQRTSSKVLAGKGVWVNSFVQPGNLAFGREMEVMVTKIIIFNGQN
jgi:hypothetical protein